MSDNCPDCGRRYGQRRRCYPCNPTRPRTGRFAACEQCANPIYVQPHQEARGQGRFCSRTCRDSSMQKGPTAGYGALHAWLARHKPRTGICDRCGDQPPTSVRGVSGTEFANISGEYRRDVDDYAELCRSCHRYVDHGRRQETAASGT